jgi:hypothetical protein
MEVVVSKREKPIQHSVEGRNLRQVQLQNEAVFACDAMTFGNFRKLPGQFSDFGKLPWGGAHSNKRGHRIAQFLGIQFQAIAADNATFLQSQDALFGRRV